MKYESLQNPKIEFISCEECSYFDYTKKKNKELILFYKLLSGYNDERITIFSNPFFLYAYKDIVKIRIPIVYGELKRFFANYKEYYYLPIEDTAVLKSVASSVDSSYRENAKKETCYIKYSGFFIPNLSSENEGFKLNYNSKTTYIEFKSNQFNESEITKYVLNLINILNN